MQHRMIKATPHARKKTVMQVYVSTLCDPDDAPDIEAYITALRAAAAELENPSVSMEEHWEPYVGERGRDRVMVSGWRNATPEEIAQVQEEQAESARARAQYEERQIADLRRSRPELFR